MVGQKAGVVARCRLLLSALRQSGERAKCVTSPQPRSCGIAADSIGSTAAVENRYVNTMQYGTEVQDLLEQCACQIIAVFPTLLPGGSERRRQDKLAAFHPPY